MNRNLPLIALALVSLIGTTALPARTIYVSPTGNDAWSGQSATPRQNDGPVATLRGARDRIREMRKREALNEPVLVQVLPGEYFMAEPLRLTPEDSGTTGTPIIYEAAPGAKPVFTGGVRITGIVERDGMWQAQAQESGGVRFEQLFVNGRRAQRARSPNTWYSFSTPATVAVAAPLTSNTEKLDHRILTLDTTHTAILTRLSAAELTSTVMVGYHSWETSRHYIEAIDSTGTAVMTGPAAWPFHRWSANQRYHLENFRAALDVPGEWYLDAASKLHYMPRPGEKANDAALIAPVTEKLIEIAGDPEHGRLVTHVTFRGLHFQDTAYHLPPGGHSDSQAEVGVSAAVEVDGARNVTFANCEFARLSGSGVWFRRGCRDCTIEYCALHDLGGGGIKIGEVVTRSDAAGPTAHITAQDNIIHGVGRLHAGAIGVWIGRSSHNRVLHNDIADCRYTGVSVGWEWGYSRSDCDHNEVGHNHIHHLGWGVLSDMGGIYTLGVSPGTTLHDNHIHDVESYNKYGAGGWGLYNDEGSSGILSQNNLVYNCATSCYHQHYGQGNTVRNNILCYGGGGVIQLSRPEPHLSFTIEQNIVCAKDEPLLMGTWGGAKVEFRNNVFWRYGADGVTSAALAYDKDKSALEAGSLIADPKFVDAKNGDFRLELGSPVGQVGFVAFKPEQASVRGDAQWRALANRPVEHPEEFAR